MGYSTPTIWVKREISNSEGLASLGTKTPIKIAAYPDRNPFTPTEGTILVGLASIPIYRGVPKGYELVFVYNFNLPLEMTPPKAEAGSLGNGRDGRGIGVSS